MMFIAALILWLPARGLDTYPTVVEQAQGLAVRKKRAEACAILRRALAGTPAGPARTRLRETLAQISRLFFTDKGQTSFETGRSVLFENVDVAIAKLRESLTLEDGNVLVRATLAKAYIVRNELDLAAAELDAARTLNPQDGEVAALDLRVLIGQKKYELFRERVKNVPPLEAFADAFVRYLQALDLLQSNQPARAAEILGRVVNEYPKFPEARFFLARAEPARSEANFRKYVDLCRALTGRDRRDFALEPRACSNLKEATDELLKKAPDL